MVILIYMKNVYTNIYKTLEFDEVYFKLTNEIRKEKLKQLENI